MIKRYKILLTGVFCLLSCRIYSVVDSTSATGAGISIVTKAIGLGKWIVKKWQFVSDAEAIVTAADGVCAGYDHFNPNKDDTVNLARQQEIAERLEILEAEEKLNECLVDNEERPLGKEGVPLVCKKASIAYEKAAGTKAFLTIRDAFRKNREYRD